VLLAWNSWQGDPVKCSGSVQGVGRWTPEESEGLFAEEPELSLTHSVILSQLTS
jgi:hypothetical protein